MQRVTTDSPESSVVALTLLRSHYTVSIKPDCSVTRNYARYANPRDTLPLRHTHCIACGEAASDLGRREAQPCQVPWCWQRSASKGRAAAQSSGFPAAPAASLAAAGLPRACCGVSACKHATAAQLGCCPPAQNSVPLRRGRVGGTGREEPRKCVRTAVSSARRRRPCRVQLSPASPPGPARGGRPSTDAPQSCTCSSAGP